MKIAVIQATSQNEKNDILYKYTCQFAKDSQVFNFGCFNSENENYSYLDIALLIGMLINSEAVDFVVTGCSSGQGMMLACNSMPGVLCGYVPTPKDAFLFAQINNGNCISLPLGQEYTYFGEDNLKSTLESLFSVPFGQGYPKEEAARKIKDSNRLKEIKNTAQRSFWEYLLSADEADIKKALNKSDVIDFILNSDDGNNPLDSVSECVKDYLRRRVKSDAACEKNVLLLGDSLRMGYQPVVSRLLMKKAGVYGPCENGRWAGYTLNSLRFWIDNIPAPDVIHWNCGLWDLGDDYNLGRPFSLPEEFISALERTITVVNKLFPKAVLIMATIMPTDNPDSSDIEGYNEIIKSVAKKHNIQVNDLFPIVKNDVTLIGPDHIHLKKEGYEIVGAKVASAIESCF